MSADFEHLVASVLNSSASAYAGLAASMLVQRHPDTASHFGSDALGTWRMHLTARVQELAVALEFDVPQIMRSSVEWTRGSFQARDVPEADLRASLVCLREVLAQELPDQARDRAVEFVDDAMQTFAAPIQSNGALTGKTAHEQLALAYVEACLTGHARRAMRLVLDAVESGQDLHAIYFEVLGPAQFEVGRLWHAAKIGVHEEHFVTSTTASLLSLLSHRAARGAENDKVVVGAAIGGDGHDLGVRMIMDFFSMAGWHAVGLGSSVPGHDLARAVQDFKADLLVLSVTLVTNLRFLRAAVKGVRKAAPETKILLGGRAFVDAPEVWRLVGADAMAMRADDAVASGARLVGLEAP